jgi:probable HAF family extracellular repeat protein
MKRFIASAFLTLASVAALAQAEYRLVDLGMLPGNTYSAGFAINNHGRVAGYSFTPDGIDPNQAFLSTQSGKRLIALGTLGGSFSDARAINNSGQIVGQSVTADGRYRAFSYRNNRMRDLGTLGGDSSEALGINAQGWIVGSSEISFAQQRAFVYRNGKMEDLNPLIDADSAAGWVLLYGYAINDANEITGIGYYRNVQRAFVLKPL